MKPVTRVIRVPAAVHLAAKVAAASQGMTLEQLAAQALQTEIERRRQGEAIKAALAPLAPIQTR